MKIVIPVFFFDWSHFFLRGMSLPRLSLSREKKEAIGPLHGKKSPQFNRVEVFNPIPLDRKRRTYASEIFGLESGTMTGNNEESKEVQQQGDGADDGVEKREKINGERDNCTKKKCSCCEKIKSKYRCQKDMAMVVYQEDVHLVKNANNPLSLISLKKNCILFVNDISDLQEIFIHNPPQENIYTLSFNPYDHMMYWFVSEEDLRCLRKITKKILQNVDAFMDKNKFSFFGDKGFFVTPHYHDGWVGAAIRYYCNCEMCAPKPGYLYFQVLSIAGLRELHNCILLLSTSNRKHKNKRIAQLMKRKF